MLSRPEGAFLLSLDLEMAWGSWQRQRFPRETFAAEPDIAAALDDLAVEQRAPFTFGVVGALAGLVERDFNQLDPDATVDAAVPALEGRYASGSLPTVRQVLASPGQWFAGPTVRRLRDSPAAHELCSHTFFHALPSSARDMIDDIAETRSTVSPELSSLIFPRDRLHFLEALSSAGVDTVRGTGESRYFRQTGKPCRLGRLAHLADQVVGRPAPLSKVHTGRPVQVTTSAYLTLREGVRRKIPMASLRRRFLTPLWRARDSGGMYHLWTHPWNLAVPRSDAMSLLTEVVVEAARLRDAGDLQILTIEQARQRM